MLTTTETLALGNQAFDIRPKPAKGIAYRPDIDGLRAIAVMAVVFYHAGCQGLMGGFVGVDVFFVISGYLIGGQVAREIVAGEFSYAAFYARRVRRILPALFATLLLFYAVGWLLMTPQEYRELGSEAVAATFGASNLLFYFGKGYFSPAAAADPLLATWSLGVEEQFYILFPALMLLVMRHRRRSAAAIIAALSLVSFVGSIALMRHDTAAAFYLLPTRAWELGLGVVLALREQRTLPRYRPRWMNEAGAAAAMAVLLLAVVLYDPAIAFPGYYALFPTLATALLITTRRSWLNRTLLAEPGMTAIGKISYSWYLWHWPVFYLNRTLAAPGTGLSPLALILVSLVIAGLSWRFIEQPFRRRVQPQPVVLRNYAIVAVGIATIGFGLFAAKGIVWRLPAASRAAAVEASAARGDACLSAYGESSITAGNACLPPLASGQTSRLVVFGDSHAAAIAPALREWTREQGIGFGQLTKVSCPPLLGFAHAQPGRPAHPRQCAAFQRQVFDYLAHHPETTTVVLAGYWGDDMMLLPVKGGDVGSVEVPLGTALSATIDRLETLGKRIVLIQDVPTYAFDPYSRTIGDALPLRAAAARALAPRWADVDAAPSTQLMPDRARPVIEAAALAGTPAVTLIDPVASLCGPASCRFRAGAATYYFDFQHLTRTGALAALQGTPFQVLRLPLDSCGLIAPCIAPTSPPAS